MHIRQRKAWIIALVLAVVGVFSFIAFRSARMPLVVVPTSSTIRVSPVSITVGPDHTYHYGGGLDLVDALVGLVSSGNRLRCTTSESKSVVWLRFDHPDFGIIPPRPQAPPRFRAALIDPRGVSIPLPIVSASIQHFRRQFLVAGWEIAGTLDDYTGSTIRIEAPDGTEAALLKVQ